ncbi:MAG: hypothetical protein KIT33_10480 [Candidatus Kapabacteria bacterium]|nr:hypothetical protein [Ignavibacteriota bacterium]MCW5885385.1 hypothetical protein [Candidatus Kapabacteria bacterium]
MNNSEKKSRLLPYIFAGFGVGILLVAFYFQFSKAKFEISDIYTDSSETGKYVFLFVETKSNKHNELLNWANDIKNSDDLLSMPDKTKPAILTVYFYNPNDTTELDEKTTNSLKERYSDKTDFTKKINYSPHGWQYIGHNDSSIEELPRDTVYKTYVFVPKTGYRAHEIIKQIY